MRFASLALVALLTQSAGAQENRSYSPPEAPGVTFFEVLPGTPLREAAGLAASSLAGDGPILSTVEPGEGVELDAASALAYTPDGSRLLAAGTLTNNLVVHDADTGAFLGALALGGGPYGLATTDDIAIVTLPVSGEIVLVDLGTLTVAHRISRPGEPAIVRLHPDGEAAWVAALGADAGVGQIAKINLQSGAIEASFPFPAALVAGAQYFDAFRRILYSTPFDVSPDGATLFIAARDEFQAYDAATGALLYTTPLPSDAYALDLTPDGTSAAVVGGFGSGYIRFIDTATGAADAAELPPLPIGFGVAISSDGQRALASVGGTGVLANRDGSHQSLSPRNHTPVPLGGDRAALVGFATRNPVFDLMNGSLVSTAPASSSTFFASSARDGERYATAPLLESAALHDAAGLRLELTLGEGEEGDAPRQAAFSPDGQTAAVSLLYSGHVAILDVASQTIVRTLEVSRPRGLAFTADDRLVIGRAEGIDVVDPATGTILATEPTPAFGNKYLYTSADGRVVVSFGGVPGGNARIYRLQNDALTLQTDYFAGGAQNSRAFDVLDYAAIDAAGRWFISTDPFEGIIRVMEIDTGTITDLQAGTFVEYVALNSDGTRAFVTAPGARGHLIDLTGTPQIIASPTFPDDVGPIAYDASRDLFVTADPFSAPSTLTEVSAETGAIVSTKTVEAPVFTTFLGLNGSEPVLVGQQVSGGGLAVYGGDEFSMDGSPAGVVISPDGRTVLVTAPGPDQISFLSLPAVSTPSPPDPTRLAVRAGPTPSEGPVHLWVATESPGEISVQVFDALGREVHAWTASAPAGEMHLVWDGRDGSGRLTAAGVYTLRIEASTGTAAARVTLVR